MLDLASSRFERLTQTADAESIPRLSPDGHKVAFVRGNDLYVYDLATKRETQLTSDGSATILNGALSWVYWEEIFDHATAGFWWSDDSSAIAFLRTDESMVDVVTFPKFSPAVPEIITQRYPKAGNANPSVKLGIVEVGSDKTAWMDQAAAGYEYILGVKWLPDNRAVAVQTTNRLQTRLDLWLVARGTGAAKLVLSDVDEAWVNQKELQFLDGGKKFVVSSERDGHTHLYLYSIDGKLLNAVTQGPWSVRGPSGFYGAPLGSAWVDEAGGWIYFTALEKSPIERHLYRIHPDGTGMERLTKEDGQHRITMSPDRRVVRGRPLRPRQLPSLSVHDAGGAQRAVVSPPARTSSRPSSSSRRRSSRSPPPTASRCPRASSSPAASTPRRSTPRSSTSTAARARPPSTTRGTTRSRAIRTSTRSSPTAATSSSRSTRAAPRARARRSRTRSPGR